MDRNTLQEEHTISRVTDEFDTNLSGPWMTRWDIVHHNKHTAALKKDHTWESGRLGDKA